MLFDLFRNRKIVDRRNTVYRLPKRIHLDCFRKTSCL